MIGRRTFLKGAASLAGFATHELYASEQTNMPLLTITAPGYYAITADYTATSTTDDAIVVAPGVHNVTILLYSRLTCLSTLSTARQNCGIRMANSNAVTVIGMGGHIRGFGWGLRADNCDNATISGLHVPDALMRGIMVDGDNTVIRDCVVNSTRGSTFTPDQYCMCIEVSGASPIVMGNIVRDFRGTNDGEGVGISVTDRAMGGTVKGNLSTGSTIDGDPLPKSIGYWVGGNSDVDFVHNHVANCFWGVAASSPTMGLFDENSFRNCTTNFNESQGDWIVGGIDG